MEKMTYVSVINDVINGVALTDEHIEKLTALKESIAKRNAKPRKKPEGPTKTALANAETADALFAQLEGEHAYPTKEVAEMLDVSVQKATAILKVLVADGRLTAEKVKGVTTYKVA